MDYTARFYSGPTYGSGGFPVFSGSRRRRRGGSFFGSLANLAMPMLKGLAKKGATQAIGLAKDVAGDVIAGRNVKDSIMRHGMRRAKRLGSDVLGTALGSMPKRQKTTVPSRKRRATSKVKQSAKRRRANF